ncbi:hypothetical protein OBV_03350 [Oscillibacter valericigenes Sjm18-20]|nr:hypothetical protein OBV_03350 [Oscillibacter valericigenes Sjm18-20]
MIQNRTFIIESIGSANKMDYQIRLYNAIAVSTLVILDSDDSGMEAYRQLISKKAKTSAEILMIKSAGMKTCELEDIVNMQEYSDILDEQYNINVDTEKFRERKRPWSDRLYEVARVSPGALDDKIKAEIKAKIADIVEKKGIAAIARYDIELHHKINCKFCKKNSIYSIRGGTGIGPFSLPESTDFHF